MARVTRDHLPPGARRLRPPEGWHEHLSLATVVWPLGEETVPGTEVATVRYIERGDMGARGITARWINRPDLKADWKIEFVYAYFISPLRAGCPAILVDPLRCSIADAKAFMNAPIEVARLAYEAALDARLVLT